MTNSKKWTKKDIKTLCGQLMTFLLQNNLYHSADAIRGAIAANRKQIIVSNLRGMESLFSERATKNQEASDHFAKNPQVYGASTPEMIERFATLAKENRAAAAKTASLIARIESETLPAEVEAFDPTAN
jgi:hypothetical protein